MNCNEANAHVRDGLIEFDPDEHVYIFKGQEFESVTTVVENCFERFDAERQAMKMANGDEAKKNALIAEWNEKGKQARDLGTLMHDRIERYYLGETLETEADTDPTFAHFRRFAAERHLTPYRTEWRIFSEKFRIAGTLDFLAVEPDGRLVIYDWKRSKKVVDKSGCVNTQHWRMAFPPLSSLPDTTYNHYALQVSIYRFILAEHYGIEVADAFLGVFHPDMPSHYCVRIPYLKDEVSTLLKHRVK